MDGPGQLSQALPRPGPALKAVLIVIGAVGILSALAVNWVPGSEAALGWLVCSTDKVLAGQVWRLVTAALLTSPASVSQLFFTLIGLYFLSPDLERRWGSGRFLRFLVLSSVAGFLLAIGFDLVTPGGWSVFHPREMYGASAAITATAIAWSMANAHLQVRLFFVVPVSGRVLFWVTIGFCVLGLIYNGTFTEGAVAPFGGVLTALLLGGNPSPLRTLYLRTKLALLRSRTRGVPSAHSIANSPSSRPGTTGRRPRAGGPPLRVVSGGLEDELKKRKPPKDKRYLN
jgi:membrane associated rhomboid family serine protease